MPVRGPLSHIDVTIRDPERSIPFYAAFFAALGWKRMRVALPDFQEPSPRRAAWFVRYPGGASFGIEVRPAEPASRDKAVDRYAPGLHHMAFHAESPADVDGSTRSWSPRRVLRRPRRHQAGGRVRAALESVISARLGA